MHRGEMPDFGYSQFKAIHFYLAKPPLGGTENYRSDISFSVVLKWLHNTWIQSPLIDLKFMLDLKGSTTQFGTFLGLRSWRSFGNTRTKL